LKARRHERPFLYVTKGLSSLLSPYFSISTLSNKTCIASVNIRSYQKNFSKLKDLVTRCPGILAIAVQETWGITGARLLPGFQPLFARTRIDKGGGGGGFLFRTGKAFTKNDSMFTQGLFETISITLLFDGKSTRLINMYKPPGLSNTQFLLFAKQLHIDKNCILLGDFNIDLSGGDNAEITAHFCASGLGQLINQLTCITHTSSSCIDNVFSSLRGTSGFILEADIADHLVVGILPASKSKVKITPKYILSPLQDPRSLSYLKDFLSCVERSPVLKDNTANSFLSFEKIIKDANDICCPTILKNYVYETD
jgi:hypothetical protein